MASARNLLPIGSVVKMKGTDKRLSIIGILVNNDGQQFDYISVPFPEGYIDAQHMFVFNHVDIEKVDYLGYMDSEFQLFRGTLADALDVK